MSGVIAVLATGKPVFGATVSPEALGGFKIGTGTIVTSQTAVVTALGGVAPYTYVWTRVSGDAQVLPVSGSSDSTKFSAYIGTAGVSYAAVYKCVVTDAAAVSIDTNSIDVTMDSF
jgi:hypothetical protein